MTAPIVIVGGGLAGTTLAWMLHQRGVPFTLLDDGKPFSSSRVAAGLITPITGFKPTVTWRWEELRDSAFAFYSRIEAEIGEHFFHQRKAVRIFEDDQESRQFRRCGDRVKLCEATLPAGFLAPFGAMTMAPAARLDVRKYLVDSHAYFADRGWLNASISGKERVVHAVGFGPCPPFAEIPFAASKGEILTLRIPGLHEDRTVNRRGTWLTPIGPELYRAGSTYDKTTLDEVPTDSGRDAILAKLALFITLPVEVVAREAAVRPIIRTSKPLIGYKPGNDSVFYFNGLGSKGSLTAPWAAAQLAAAIADGTPPDPEIDLATFLSTGRP